MTNLGMGNGTWKCQIKKANGKVVYRERRVAGGHAQIWLFRYVWIVNSALRRGHAQFSLLIWNIRGGIIDCWRSCNRLLAEL